MCEARNIAALWLWSLCEPGLTHRAELPQLQGRVAYLLEPEGSLYSACLEPVSTQLHQAKSAPRLWRFCGFSD